MQRLNFRWIVFFLIAAVGCAIDLFTKKLAFDRLGIPSHNSSVHWLCRGLLGFQTSLNEGALFGLGQGGYMIFAGLSIIAAIGILIWFFGFGASKDRLLTVALGLVMAGILGNLFDRLGLPGMTWNGLDGLHAPGQTVHAVRDFILIMVGPWHWPNFNIADSCLVVGACLLFIHAWYVSLPEGKTEEPAAHKPEEPTAE